MAKSKYAPVKYYGFNEEPPKNAEYIMRKLSDGSGLLQQYKNGRQFDLYRCWWEGDSEESFKAMLVEARKHMPENKMLYVEKPSYMYSKEDDWDDWDDWDDLDDFV